MVLRLEPEREGGLEPERQRRAIRRCTLRLGTCQICADWKEFQRLTRLSGAVLGVSGRERRRRRRRLRGIHLGEDEGKEAEESGHRHSLYTRGRGLHTCGWEPGANGQRDLCDNRGKRTDQILCAVRERLPIASEGELEHDAPSTYTDIGIDQFRSTSLKVPWVWCRCIGLSARLKVIDRGIDRLN
jgi:hypothetical protein